MLGLTKPTVQKFNRDKIYIDILLSNDNLFFEAYEVIGDAIYCIIQYIGQEKEASQFKYKFVLESGAEEITVCNVASSYITDVKEVYNIGKCVKLFCDIIKRFFDKDKNSQFYAEIDRESSIWVRALPGPMHLGLKTGPLCLMSCTKLQELCSFTNFQMAPTTSILMSSSSKKKEPRYLCLSETKASHSPKICTVSSSVPHFLQMGLLLSPITCRYLLKVLYSATRSMMELFAVPSYSW